MIGCRVLAVSRLVSSAGRSHTEERSKILKMWNDIHVRPMLESGKQSLTALSRCLVRGFDSFAVVVLMHTNQSGTPNSRFLFVLTL